MLPDACAVLGGNGFLTCRHFFFLPKSLKDSRFVTLVSFLLKAFNLCMKKKEAQETKYHNDNHLY